MESIRNVISMMQPDCWMASLDLKDAYYSVPIHPKSRRFLKFICPKGNVYKYPTLPNGYRDAARIFTKLLKPVFGTLRELGYQSVAYLDDAYLQGTCHRQCTQNIRLSIRVLQALGYTIHPTKSILEPVQEIETLGFVVNSKTMTISLPQNKKAAIKELCQEALTYPKLTIRQVARLVGTLVATSEAVPLAPLYYKRLEREKDKALKLSRGNYEKWMMI